MGSLIGLGLRVGVGVWSIVCGVDVACFGRDSKAVVDDDDDDDDEDDDDDDDDDEDNGDDDDVIIIFVLVELPRSPSLTEALDLAPPVPPANILCNDGESPILS